MSTMDNSLSVVIPVYNSYGIIDKLVSRLTPVLSSLSEDFEIIFVNDCSPDDSWLKLSALAASDHHVRAVSLRKNVGYDNALMAGLRFVSRAFVVIMDDDLQHAPEDIPLLWEEIQNGHDVVYANFQKKRQSLIKNAGSWLNGKIAQLIINKPPDVYMSPFKMIRREVAREIVKYDGPFPYIDGLIFQVTSSIHQVRVTHHQRQEGEGGHGIFRSLRILFNFCTTFSILPLRISTLAGFIISMLACFYSVVLIAGQLIYGVDVAGWLSIMLAVLLLGGIQLMSLGVIGEYIGRAYMNINRQPQYVIKEIRGKRLSEETDGPGKE